jgi:hypothetical protein
MPASGWRAKAAMTSSSQCASVSVSLFSSAISCAWATPMPTLQAPAKPRFSPQRQCLLGYSAANSERRIGRAVVHHDGLHAGLRPSAQVVRQVRRW